MEFQNFLAQSNPSPLEYGLNRAEDGTLVSPRSLISVSTSEGNNTPLPTLGFVLYF
jgi:hypothetical protein